MLWLTQQSFPLHWKGSFFTSYLLESTRDVHRVTLNVFELACRYLLVAVGKQIVDESLVDGFKLQFAAHLLVEDVIFVPVHWRDISRVSLLLLHVAKHLLFKRDQSGDFAHLRSVNRLVAICKWKVLIHFTKQVSYRQYFVTPSFSHQLNRELVWVWITTWFALFLKIFREARRTLQYNNGLFNMLFL